ncbi:MAG: M48 family metalloprotease [Cocleimonas sp.]|nr:M48 family metalloprotease [Cocleimonas sp.]
MILSRKFTQTVSILAVSASLTLTACSVNPVTGKKNFSLISKDQEVQMGKQAHQDVLKTQKPYNNTRLQTYVSSLGQQLASKSHRNAIRYTFTVLDDPNVNAFALPGGYVYITTGLMAYLNSEGELAGVLGHEIGHVTARHGVQQASAGMAASVLVDLISKNAGGNNKMLNQLGSAMLSGYGRDHELQADRLGAEYLAEVGYDPKNMIDVIGVLKAQEVYASRQQGRRAGSYHGLFSSHPSNDQRLQEVVGAAKKIKSAGTRSTNRNAYLKQINGLKFKISKNKTGRIVVGNVRTAGLTFEQLAKKSVVGAAQLRLLNGRYPEGGLNQGELIKIVKK